MSDWLTGVRIRDLHTVAGNGRFTNFLGVIVHVNVGDTPIGFWYNNPDNVTPNFQVHKDGSIDQMLPINWRPWCQRNGNDTYAAIETAGYPNEPYTTAQINSIARILRAYHTQMGMPYAIANAPGQRGVGTHAMGGLAWGGHTCPGTVRANQRAALLKAASGVAPAPAPTGPHLRRAWPSYMPSGHYFGLISGPAQSHGGYFVNERPDIKAIQTRLQQLRYAPTTAGWADGIFEQPTANAVAAWQKAHMPGTQYYGQVWRDDWNKLFTY